MRTKYSGLAFLAELLVNVAVFSLSCAILVGVFARSSMIAVETTQENLAMVELCSLTEVIKANGEEVLSGVSKDEQGNLWLSYGDDWRPSAGKAVYKVKLTLCHTAKVGGILTQIVAVAYTAEGKEISHLETSCYQQEKGGSKA